MKLSIYKGSLFVLIIFVFFACNENSEKAKQPIVDSIKVEAESQTSKIASTSQITCPKCQHKKTEQLPTDVCLLSYTCEKCKTVLHPKKGDCCVFCTYGDVKCPSMQ